eukprot:scaffold492_cov141-Skeletonema_menzelii.AAC.2
MECAQSIEGSRSSSIRLSDKQRCHSETFSTPSSNNINHNERYSYMKLYFNTAAGDVELSK